MGKANDNKSENVVNQNKQVNRSHNEDQVKQNYDSSMSEIKLQYEKDVADSSDFKFFQSIGTPLKPNIQALQTQQKTKGQMSAQDVMSSYLFKNASKGKVANVNPNKLAKFIFQKEKKVAEKKEKSQQETKSRSPVNSKRVTREAKPAQTMQRMTRRSSSPLYLGKQQKTPTRTREQRVSQTRKPETTKNSNPPQNVKLKNQDVLIGSPSFRSKTPDMGRKINPIQQKMNEDFKEQFTQYLEALKEKVADMELNVKEAQNERNFFKGKFEESEELLNYLREKEKDFSIQVAQLSASNANLEHKINKKKKLLASMQQTVCNLSVSLEQHRKEIDDQKKGSKGSGYPQSTIPRFDLRQEDSFSVSSAHKFQMGEFFGARQIDPNDFGSINEKIDDMQEEMNVPNAFLVEENDVSNDKMNQIKLDFKNDTSPQNPEDDELVSYLDGGERTQRKDKFKAFAKRYGIENLINLKPLIGHSLQTPMSQKHFDFQEDQDNLQIDSDLDMFIKFLAQKLMAEQKNRLKTEEQSALVIEQLGKTISRLEVKKDAGFSSKMSTPLPQDKKDFTRSNTYKPQNNNIYQEQ